MNSVRQIAGVAALAMLWSGVAIGADSGAATTLIVNASIVDGTGSPARAGAVRIEGDRIVEVGALESQERRTRRGCRWPDAGARLHRHAQPPRGRPVRDARRLAGREPGHHDDRCRPGRSKCRYPLGSCSSGWIQTPTAINVASYVGHATFARRQWARRFPAACDADGNRPKMRELGAGRDGRRARSGFATGLEYDPGIYSSTEELIELAKEAAAFGGRYISHIRSEDRYFWKAHRTKSCASAAKRRFPCRSRT